MNLIHCLIFVITFIVLSLSYINIQTLSFILEKKLFIVFKQQSFMYQSWILFI